MDLSNIYIAEDRDGVLRISCGHDPSLASAKWRSTDAMTIYCPYGNTWWGSCRMSKRARQKYYKAGLGATRSWYMSFNKAIERFAKGMAKLKELQDTSAASAPSQELCLGEWTDDSYSTSLVVSYRHLYAKVFSVRLDFPAKGYTKMLAVYKGGKLLSSFPISSGNRDQQVVEIVEILDEVADGKRTDKPTGRGSKGAKANR